MLILSWRLCHLINRSLLTSKREEMNISRTMIFRSNTTLLKIILSNLLTQQKLSRRTSLVLVGTFIYCAIVYTFLTYHFSYSFCCHFRSWSSAASATGEPQPEQSAECWWTRSQCWRQQSCWWWTGYGPGC